MFITAGVLLCQTNRVTLSLRLTKCAKWHLPTHTHTHTKNTWFVLLISVRKAHHFKDALLLRLELTKQLHKKKIISIYLWKHGESNSFTLCVWSSGPAAPPLAKDKAKLIRQPCGGIAGYVLHPGAAQPLLAAMSVWGMKMCMCIYVPACLCVRCVFVKRLRSQRWKILADLEMTNGQVR